MDRHILVIDDEANMRHMLGILLANAGYRVDQAANGLEGLEKLRAGRFDFILCDLKMPAMDGLEFLQRAGAEHLSTRTTIIMMSAYGTIDTAVEAMKLGAYDYISKPFQNDEILLVLEKAEERESLKAENRKLKETIGSLGGDFSFGKMVAQSREMAAVFQLARKMADFPTTVLITGESGTGKELIARGIHQAGSRSARSLVPVNCGGIPGNLLESELFGFKKGAFTGADKDRKGLFEEADGGTIFLDEIGELPLELQVKLLRVLQEHEIRPLGDSRTRKVDVRVIAATQRDLETEAKAGNFREDLFYRLHVVTIRIPPLRERKEDIPLLCRHFLARANVKLGRQVREISSAALARLLDYPWPGNVRELENMMERAVILADGEVLEPAHFPEEIGSPLPVPGPSKAITEGYSLKAAQERLERQMIAKALAKSEGNRTRAARLLEISHPSLLSKMKRYGLS